MNRTVKNNWLNFFNKSVLQNKNNKQYKNSLFVQIFCLEYTEKIYRHIFIYTLNQFSIQIKFIMNKADIRKMTIQKIKNYLEPNLSLDYVQLTQKLAKQPLHRLQVQNQNFQKVRYISSKISRKHTEVIFQAHHLLICDNLSAISLALYEIIFQEYFIGTRIISELKSNFDQMSNLQNCPFLNCLQIRQWEHLFLQVLLQICDHYQKDEQISLIKIIKQIPLAIQIMSLAVRMIMCKLKYPDADNYTNSQIGFQTLEIFTIICEYLDIKIQTVSTDKTSSKNGLQYFEAYFINDYKMCFLTQNHNQFVYGNFSLNEVSQNYQKSLLQRSEENGVKQFASLSIQKMENQIINFSNNLLTSYRQSLVQSVASSQSSEISNILPKTPHFNGTEQERNITFKDCNFLLSDEEQNTSQKNSLYNSKDYQNHELNLLPNRQLFNLKLNGHQSDNIENQKSQMKRCDIRNQFRLKFSQIQKVQRAPVSSPYFTPRQYHLTSIHNNNQYDDDHSRVKISQFEKEYIKSSMKAYKIDINHKMKQKHKDIIDKNIIYDQKQPYKQTFELANEQNMLKNKVHQASRIPTKLPKQQPKADNFWTQPQKQKHKKQTDNQAPQPIKQKILKYKNIKNKGLNTQSKQLNKQKYAGRCNIQEELKARIKYNQLSDYKDNFPQFLKCRSEKIIINKQMTISNCQQKFLYKNLGQNKFEKRASQGPSYKGTNFIPIRSNPRVKTQLYENNDQNCSLEHIKYLFNNSKSKEINSIKTLSSSLFPSRSHSSSLFNGLSPNSNITKNQFMQKNRKTKLNLNKRLLNIGPSIRPDSKLNEKITQKLKNNRIPQRALRINFRQNLLRNRQFYFQQNRSN